MLRTNLNIIVRFFKKAVLSFQRRGFLRNSVLLITIIILAVLASFATGQLLQISPGQQENLPSDLPDVKNRLDDVPATAFERGDVIVVGVSESFSIVNPLFSFSDGENDAVSLLFEPLIRPDSEGEPVGCLAKSWAFDPVSEEISFWLHQNHIFRDGRPLNIDDIIFTYKCLLSDSYNGPLRGRFSSILSVRAGADPNQVVFAMWDLPNGPDYSLFSVGILKADHYAIDLDRVFDMPYQNIPVEGSGPFQVVGMKPDRLVLSRRSGYGGAVKQVVLRQVASEDKYRLLLDGEIDIARNNWDIRMRQRAVSLSGYSLHHLSSRIDSYFLVNPAQQTGSVIQLPSQSLAILLTAAGQELSVLQHSALEGLSGQKLTLFCFAGLDPSVLAENKAQAETIAKRLRRTGIDVIVSAIDWPDLAARAASQDYDILLLPATANNRLPDNTILLSDPVHPATNAWISAYREEVFIISNRLAQLTINPFGHPLSYLAGTWTDRIENVRILDRKNTIWEANNQ